MAKAKTVKGVLCNDCEHLNPPGSVACEYCHADLFVKCHACGATTQKVLSVCQSCQKPLSRSSRRHRKHSQRAARRTRFLRISAGAAVFLLGLYVVIDWLL